MTANPVPTRSWLSILTEVAELSLNSQAEPIRDSLRQMSTGELKSLYRHMADVRGEVARVLIERRGLP